MPTKEEDTPDNSIIEVPEKYRARIIALDDYRDRINADLFPADFGVFNDEQLAAIIASEHKGGRFLHELAIVYFSLLIDLDHLVRPLSHPVWIHVRNAIKIALYIRLQDEFQRRRKLKENAYGRVVRAFVVEPDINALNTIDKMTIGRMLRTHPDFSNRREGMEEIVSMVHAQLVSRTAKYLDPENEPLKNLGLRLLDSLQGRLNFVLRNTRRDVLDQLKKARMSRERLLEFHPKPVDDHNNRDYLESLVELKPINDAQPKIFLERIRSLKGRDKAIVEMVLEGRSQSEIAQKYRISQQAISIRLKRIKGKLRD